MYMYVDVRQRTSTSTYVNVRQRQRTSTYVNVDVRWTYVDVRWTYPTSDMLTTNRIYTATLTTYYRLFQPLP